MTEQLLIVGAVCYVLGAAATVAAWYLWQAIESRRSRGLDLDTAERPPQHYNCRCTTEPSDWRVRMEAAIAKLRADQELRLAAEKIRKAQANADAAIKWQRENPSSNYAREMEGLNKWAREVLRKHEEKPARRLRVLARAVVVTSWPRHYQGHRTDELRIVKVLDHDGLLAACIRGRELELVEVRKTKEVEP